MSNELRNLNPQFSIDEAKLIAKKYYHLNEYLGQLPSERDQNFLFENNQSKFILKISNIDETCSIIDMQNKAMELISNGIKVIPSQDGQKIIEYKNHLIRLVNYVEGIPLAHYETPTPKFFYNLGKVLGNVDKCLIGFEHESMNRYLYWNMINAKQILCSYKHLIIDKSHREIIENILNHWIDFILPKFEFLRLSIIHNDANDYNIIITDQNNISLIDYGDMCRTFVLCEPAIACAYAMLNKENPIEIASDIIQGYNEIYPLESIEIDLVYYFIRMRLAMSVTISAHQKEIQPENEYLIISEKPAWNLLEKLNKIDQNFICQTFRSICNLAN